MDYYRADKYNALAMIIQCDFDGTITEEDVSFMLLDAFARDGLLDGCREMKNKCTPFNDLNDIVRGLELL
jgi:2-hydroxy-3-keto-5-methylthiopentenyl-1-phosphate phosphatase